MKIIKIEKCFDCNFFKVIDADDNLGLCMEAKRYITEFDQSVLKEGDHWFESEIMFVAGTIPDWCSLEDYKI